MSPFFVTEELCNIILNTWGIFRENNSKAISITHPQERNVHHMYQEEGPRILLVTINFQCTHLGHCPTPRHLDPSKDSAAQKQKVMIVLVVTSTMSPFVTVECGGEVSLIFPSSSSHGLSHPPSLHPVAVDRHALPAFIRLSRPPSLHPVAMDRLALPAFIQ